MVTKLWYAGVAAAVALVLATTMPRMSAQAAGVRLGTSDIGGVVTSPNGPEAGVWVIAETKDLPTKYVKIVVTDDRGRYLMPELPRATYGVWVRGYGLVDSPKVQAAPGKALDLTAVVAPDARAAAQYYPADYWLSLLKIPDTNQFPGTGIKGNGISETMKTQEQFLGLLTTNGCNTCHQLGTAVTRNLPKNMGPFASTTEAWDRRVESGQSGSSMSNQLSQFGRRFALQMFADWTDRIAKGEVPQAPPRPQGVERNVVITEWDWGNEHEFVHDEVTTDERKPTVNANGLIYGTTEFSGDRLLVLDPVKNSWTGVPVPYLDPKKVPPLQWAREALQPSPVWGEEVIWNSHSANHNPMIDGKGRVWITSTVRPPADQPAWCKAGSSHPSAKMYPLDRGGRHLAVYDPKDRSFTPIDLCFSTHHLDFGYDANDTLWFDGTPGVVGWFSTKIWDETHDAQKAQGWIPFVLDTNGNGKMDAWVEPGTPVDPMKDKRIGDGGYDVSGSPDGSAWLATATTPGYLIRVAPGAHPPDTALVEAYTPPLPGHTMRGGPELDSAGVAWVALGSGHMASFDRRKCKVLNGPTAIGPHCPEGWTLYPDPSPTFKGTDRRGTDGHYLTWVDQFDTSGLGKNIPFATGSNSDALLAMLPGGKWVTLRVPYPMGFMPKGMDGRIDDVKGGWKGKALWTTYAGQAMWHKEGGKGQTSTVVKIQLRPDPLAH